MGTIKLTWNDIHQALHNLTNEVDLKNFDCILAPNRGGLIITGMLQYLQSVKLPVYVINDSNVINIQNHKKILFLDDINDTSKTIFKIQKNFNGFVTFKTLFERHDSPFKTETINIIMNDAWLIFPWDVEPKVSNRRK
ncbi:TPA: hypothetical protein SB288_001758 [Campylobacter coli]|nr:hypothetical protein [Campylobacter coli]